MSNFGEPNVGDLEIAVSALKSAADRALSGPIPDVESMQSLRRVADALEALLPRSQTVSLSRIKPRQWQGGLG